MRRVSKANGSRMMGKKSKKTMPYRTDSKVSGRDVIYMRVTDCLWEVRMYTKLAFQILDVGHHKRERSKALKSRSYRHY